MEIGIHEYPQEFHDLRAAKIYVQAETRNIFLFWEALRCTYKRLVNYKFLVYNEDTLR